MAVPSIVPERFQEAKVCENVDHSFGQSDSLTLLEFFPQNSIEDRYRDKIHEMSSLSNPIVFLKSKICRKILSWSFDSVAFTEGPRLSFGFRGLVFNI